MRRKGRIKGKDQGWRRGEGSGVRFGKRGIIKGEKKTEREGLSVTGRVKCGKRRIRIKGRRIGEGLRLAGNGEEFVVGEGSG